MPPKVPVANPRYEWSDDDDRYWPDEWTCPRCGTHQSASPDEDDLSVSCLNACGYQITKGEAVAQLREALENPNVPEVIYPDEWQRVIMYHRGDDVSAYAGMNVHLVMVPDEA